MKNIFTYFSNLKAYALAHKIISSLALVAIVGGGWYAYSLVTAPSSATSYILGTVSTNTIVSSVSESGQIAAFNTVNIQPKVSGSITKVYVKVGQAVHTGQALMSIDDTTALQQYNNDKATLAADELQYQKDAATAPISFQNDQTALTNAQQSLADEYSNAYDVLATTYLDEPTVSTGLNEALYGYDFSTNGSQQNIDALGNLFTSTSQVQQVQSFQTSAKADYASARVLYDPAVLAYKGTSRSSSNADITAVLQQSIDSTTALAQAAQSTLNFLSEVQSLATANNQKLPSAFTTLQTNARSYLSTVNSDLNNLLAEKKTLTNDAQTVTTDQQNVQLDQVGNTNGANPISLQIEANNIEKEKQTIATDATNLSYYTVVAPFNGTISAVDIQVGGNAGSAAVASIISNNSIAQLSVNEVDAAKINLGQKATLTFDAIPNLTMTGTVAEIDPAGTVSQGVVTYNLQISLDTQDARVKSGMSVNANIQTALAQNALTVPSSAVKTTNGTSYILAFTPPIASSTVAASGSQGVTSATPPMSVPVTLGISDNTNTQILSGLTPGEQIVVRAVIGTATTKTAAATATSRTTGGAAGGFGGGGAAGGSTIRL